MHFKESHCSLWLCKSCIQLDSKGLTKNPTQFTGFFRYAVGQTTICNTLLFLENSTSMTGIKQTKKSLYQHDIRFHPIVRKQKLHVFSHLNILSLLVCIKSVVYNNLKHTEYLKVYSWKLTKIKRDGAKLPTFLKNLKHYILNISLRLTKDRNWITEVVIVLVHGHICP